MAPLKHIPAIFELPAFSFDCDLSRLIVTGNLGHEGKEEIGEELLFFVFAVKLRYCLGCNLARRSPGQIWSQTDSSPVRTLKRDQKSVLIAGAGVRSPYQSNVVFKVISGNLSQITLFVRDFIHAFLCLTTRLAISKSAVKHCQTDKETEKLGISAEGMKHIFPPFYLQERKLRESFLWVQIRPWRRWGCDDFPVQVCSFRCS